MMPAQASPANGPELRDIHLPPSPSWWPLAPGWWLLAALVLALLALAWWWRARHRRQHALEQRVLAEVDAVLAASRHQPSQLVADLHQLLRRGALRVDPHATQQQGVAWRDTLARVAVDPATMAQLLALEAALYRPDVAIDVDQAAQATRVWLRQAWRDGGRKAIAARATP